MIRFWIWVVILQGTQQIKNHAVRAVSAFSLSKTCRSKTIQNPQSKIQNRKLCSFILMAILFPKKKPGSRLTIAGSSLPTAPTKCSTPTTAASSKPTGTWRGWHAASANSTSTDSIWTYSARSAISISVAHTSSAARALRPSLGRSALPFTWACRLSTARTMAWPNPVSTHSPLSRPSYPG